MYVVVSTVHLPDHDRTFVHGIFQDKSIAQSVCDDIESDLSFVEEEGYIVPPNTEVSVYISDIPMGVRVNDFVPTIQ